MIKTLPILLITVALAPTTLPNDELTTVNLCDEIHAELTYSSKDLGINKEAVQAIYNRCLEIM